MKAAILGPVVEPADGGAVFVTGEVLPVLVHPVWENIPPKIETKLLSKGRNIISRDGFTDGNLVFHLLSSKFLFGELDSVHPPYTVNLHTNHPFCDLIVFRHRFRC